MQIKNPPQSILFHDENDPLNAVPLFCPNSEEGGYWIHRSLPGVRFKNFDSAVAAAEMVRLREPAVTWKDRLWMLLFIAAAMGGSFAGQILVEILVKGGVR